MLVFCNVNARARAHAPLAARSSPRALNACRRVAVRDDDDGGGKWLCRDNDSSSGVRTLKSKRLIAAAGDKILLAPSSVERAKLGRRALLWRPHQRRRRRRRRRRAAHARRPFSRSLVASYVCVLLLASFAAIVSPPLLVDAARANRRSHSFCSLNERAAKRVDAAVALRADGLQARVRTRTPCHRRSSSHRLEGS